MRVLKQGMVISNTNFFKAMLVKYAKRQRCFGNFPAFVFREIKGKSNGQIIHHHLGPRLARRTVTQISYICSKYVYPNNLFFEPLSFQLAKVQLCASGKPLFQKNAASFNTLNWITYSLNKQSLNDIQKKRLRVVAHQNSQLAVRPIRNLPLIPGTVSNFSPSLGNVISVYWPGSDLAPAVGTYLPSPSGTVDWFTHDSRSKLNRKTFSRLEKVAIMLFGNQRGSILAPATNMFFTIKLGAKDVNWFNTKQPGVTVTQSRTLVTKCKKYTLVFEGINNEPFAIRNYRNETTGSDYRMRSLASGMEFKAAQFEFLEALPKVKTEINSIKQLVVETQNVVVEQLKSNLSSRSPNSIQTANFHRITDKVYQELERRIRTEKERRGL